MNIVISGTTGLIGGALKGHFEEQGHNVSRILRQSSEGFDGDNSVVWDLDEKFINKQRLAAHDVVIHLAGANIAGRRWTPEYKQEILNSRTVGTRLISEAIAGFKMKPKLFCSASAVGIYGANDGSVTFDESGSSGAGFLADVCRQWEQATRAAEDAGIRVVHLRFGVVLSSKGGALAKMLPPFKFGLGGVVGTGRQYMSWIALDEIPLIVDHIIKTETIRGAVNAVSPSPVSNRQFTSVLGDTLHRPTIFPLPSFVVKLLFGEMGENLLLSGQKVLPKKLLDSGYQFQYSDLQSALEQSLN